MKQVHWVIKYYLIVFPAVFLIAFLIEKSEPKVNWLLYDKNLKERVEKAILIRNCKLLKDEFDKEYNLNYEKNYFGFLIRKDKKMQKGLNLLKYLEFHINDTACLK